MEKQFVVYRKVYENIPGYHDSSIAPMKIFKTKEEAQAYVNTFVATSVNHAGFGAGSGSVETTYIIEEE